MTDYFSHSLPVRRVLLIQLGDIGDVVWSLPALRAVQEAFPEAEIAVLLREGNGALLEADLRPPEIFEVCKGAGGGVGGLAASLRLIRALRRKRFDIVFDLRADERGGYMAFATGAPVRVAQYYPQLPWPRNSLFTDLMTFPEFPEQERAATLSLGILRAFGIKVGSAVPTLHLSEEIRRRASWLLSEEGICPAAGLEKDGEKGGSRAGRNPRPGCYVATLNPFSRWPYKEWSPGKWAQVIDWLWQDFNLPSLIVGSPSERERADGIVKGSAAKVFNLAGKTTLAELAGILAQSRLHIGVDSAAPHIAAAVGTPTVTLYGPSDGNYWGPPGERHRIVVPRMPCVPCRLKGCEGKGVSRCLEALDVASVQAAIRAALEGKKQSEKDRWP